VKGTSHRNARRVNDELDKVRGVPSQRPARQRRRPHYGSRMNSEGCIDDPASRPSASGDDLKLKKRCRVGARGHTHLLARGCRQREEPKDEEEIHGPGLRRRSWPSNADYTARLCCEIACYTAKKMADKNARLVHCARHAKTGQQLPDHSRNEMSVLGCETLAV